MQKKRTNNKQKQESKFTNKLDKKTTKRSSYRKDSDLQSTTNDPSWYAVDPVILRDAASFPFAHPAGHPMYLTPGSNTSTYNPGAMTLYLSPTVPTKDGASAPVNIAATQSYAFIRHGNSGSVNYDAGDLMLYFLAMSEVYSYIEWLKRIYGLAQLYAQRNRYMPYSLIRANEVDPNDVLQHMADFRLGINMLVNKAASFAVPNTMSIFKRRAFLYQNVYTEGDSIKDQMYQFAPYTFQEYIWNSSKLRTRRCSVEGFNYSIGSKVSQELESGKPLNVEYLLTYGNHLIDNIISNEDLGTMNGDILKVYGDNIIKLNHIAEDYIVVPVKDMNVLEQMQNATLLRGVSISSLDVTSSYTEGEESGGVSIISSRPYISGTAIPASGKVTDDDIESINALCGYLPACINHVLTTESAQVTPELIMEITRLTSHVSEEPGSTDHKLYIDSGTEIVADARIYRQPASSTAKGTVFDYYQLTYNPAAVLKEYTIPSSASTWKNYATWMVDKSSQMMLSMSMGSAFKYAPLRLYDNSLNGMFAKCSGESTDDTFNNYYGVTAVSGNLCNFSVIDARQLEKLHGVAMLNEFATPHVALV